MKIQLVMQPLFWFLNHKLLISKKYTKNCHLLQSSVAYQIREIAINTDSYKNFGSRLVESLFIIPCQGLAHK